jgi:hypothetical protein
MIGQARHGESFSDKKGSHNATLYFANQLPDHPVDITTRELRPAALGAAVSIVVEHPDLYSAFCDAVLIFGVNRPRLPTLLYRHIQTPTFLYGACHTLLRWEVVPLRYFPNSARLQKPAGNTRDCAIVNTNGSKCGFSRL